MEGPTPNIGVRGGVDAKLAPARIESYKHRPLFIRLGARFVSSGRAIRYSEPVATQIIIGLLLIAAAALPWSTRYLPNGDGPTHLNIAWIFGHLISDASSLAAKFYEIRQRFFTNYGTEAIGLVMLPLIGPVAAEKLLFMISIVGMPAAIIGGIYAVDRRASPLMVLALPYGYTSTLASGNFNFLLGTILQLAIFAVVLSRRDPPGKVLGTIIAVGGLILVAIHPAPAVLLLFSGGILVLARSLRQWSVDRSAALRLSIAYGVTMLPMIVVIAIFLATSPSSVMEYQRPAFLRLREFLIEYQFYKLGRYEIYLALALSATLGGVTLFALWRRWPWKFADSDLLLLVGFATFILYMVSPNKMSGGDAFVARIETLPWLFLLMWLAAQRLPNWLTTTILIAGALLQCALLAGAYRAHALASRDMAQYFKLAESASRGSVLVPVIGDVIAQDTSGEPVASPIATYQHLHNTIAIQKDAVFLENWNAHYRVANVEFRSDNDPYPYLWSGDLGAGLAEYELRTGIHPDGILIWRLSIDSKEWVSLKPRLDSEYQLITALPGSTISAFYSRKRP